MNDSPIGFIGAGQMASALARGIVQAGLVDASRIIASDPAAAARDAFEKALPGARCYSENAEVIEQCQTLFLCIKPQGFAAVAEGLRPYVKERHLVVSILAGLTLRCIAQGMGTDRVIRVMPNTPCLIGKGASGYAAGPGASEEDLERTGALLASVGLALPVEEHLLDAVTGLSGSGPAYAFQFIEALCEGGIRKGLPRPIAMQLAAQTVMGAAAMVLETGEDPAILRDRVSSPGGTTIAGLEQLESGGLSSLLIAAVDAATKRSGELARLN